MRLSSCSTCSKNNRFTQIKKQTKWSAFLCHQAPLCKGSSAIGGEGLFKDRRGRRSLRKKFLHTVGAGIARQFFELCFGGRPMVAPTRYLFTLHFSLFLHPLQILPPLKRSPSFRQGGLRGPSRTPVPTDTALRILYIIYEQICTNLHKFAQKS